MNPEIKLDKAFIKKLDNQIIEVDYLNESNIELVDAKAVHEGFLKISNQQPFTVLIDGRGKYVNFSPEAKEFYAKDISVKGYKYAMAMVIDSLPTRIIAKFYLTFHKPYYSTKIFSNRKDAILWLHQKVNKEEQNY